MFIPITLTLPEPATTLHFTKQLSLKEAVLLALRNNADVVSSKLQRVVDKFALEVAHNAFMPQFSLSGEMNYTPASGETSYHVGPGFTWTTPFGTQLSMTYQGNAALTVTQPLLQGAGWAYNQINWFNAEDNERLAQLNFANSMTATVINVITTYYLLVQDYRHADIEQHALQRAEQIAQQTALQVKAGRIAPSDLAQQRTVILTTRLSLMQQKNILRADYQHFLQVLGLAPTAHITIDTHLKEKQNLLPSLQNSLRAALINNANYQAAQLRVRVLSRAMLAAKNQQRWQLDVTGSAAVIQDHPGNRILPAMGLSLNIPLNQLQNKQQLIATRVAWEQAKLALHQQKQVLIGELINQHAQLRNQSIQIKIATQMIRLQKLNLSQALLKLKYGRATLFEINQLQDQLLQQENNLIDSKISFLNQITLFQQTTGLLLHFYHIMLRES